jgi:hypothetical protein
MFPVEIAAIGPRKEDLIMRKLALITTLALTLGLGAGAAHAQALADLSAVHGIPGLQDPVTVVLTGAADVDFMFEYGDIFGPAAVPAGTYNVEIIDSDSTTLLTGSATLQEGRSYTAVAHLNEAGDAALLSFFENEISPLRWREARLQIFHLAAAPTVDAAVRRGAQRFWSRVELVGLSNGDQATAIDITKGRYNVGLLAGGDEVFNTGAFRLRSGDNLAVFAVGDFLGGSFQLIYLPLN